MDKSLLDGYIGIKFQAECISSKLPFRCIKCISSFKENGKILFENDMAPANGGNMSLRYEKGFLITASECNLGHIEDNEITYVEEYSLKDKSVKYRGKRLPSSETFLHGLLYNEKEDILSVIHAHDTMATSMDLAGIIHETEKEEPYGTIALAKQCLETFCRGSDIIVLKNHGYVAAGSSISKVTEVIVTMHEYLVQIKEKIKQLTCEACK